jgi:hypothetical protein
MSCCFSPEHFGFIAIRCRTSVRSARFKKGVLTVMLPKSAEAQISGRASYVTS